MIAQADYDRPSRGPPRPGLAGRALSTHTRPPDDNLGTEDRARRPNPGRGLPRPGLAARALSTCPSPPFDDNLGTKDIARRPKSKCPPPGVGQRGAWPASRQPPPIPPPTPPPQPGHTPLACRGSRRPGGRRGGETSDEEASGLGQRGARDTLGGIPPIPGRGAYTEPRQHRARG